MLQQLKILINKKQKYMRTVKKKKKETRQIWLGNKV